MFGGAAWFLCEFASLNFVFCVFKFENPISVKIQALMMRPPSLARKIRVLTALTATGF
ncbi:hypothetical protein CRECT_0605 [Campylobacter rectus]|uniref:Uncharacterized protein n=1 Tax=Campylobacter rectus TaxID=203 RepID=A0A6G5QL17_CAMRE|nr:hypothetical protein CRECT_0605 [Campylobacter rectus]